MKRLILFSTPSEKILPKILESLMPKDRNIKKLAYMPSDGATNLAKYTDLWIDHCQKCGYEFWYIDNSKEGSAAKNEIEKMRQCSSLIITGGNTFHLLRNLRRSGLDKEIINFTKKDDYILAGFSAGALVLTPIIEVCNLPMYDENLVRLKDLTGLGLVNFEILPHYEEKWQELISEYRKTTKREVRTISNEEIIVIEK